jgi:hypothetical protein
LFCGVTAFSSTVLTFKLMIVVGISVPWLTIVHGVPDGELRAVLAMGKRRFERMAASGGESTAPRRNRIGFARILVEDHAADDLASHQRQCFLAPTNDRHDADRLHPRTELDRDLAYLIRTLLRF